MPEYLVTIKSMHSPMSESRLFQDLSKANDYAKKFSDFYNLNEWNGKESGGVGYSYRITNETV
jgi:hypothetical protein